MTRAAGPWVDAAAAARLLGVTRATLYAYVSRGYVRSQAAPGRPRERTYSRDDIVRLRERADQRRSPEQTAAKALQWGLPVLESAIALIDGRRLYYRGEDAVRLADSRTVEEVAALIWTGDSRRRLPTPDTVPQEATTAATSVRRRQRFIARAQSSLAEAASHDPAAFDRRPDALARIGWRIVWLLTAAAAGRASVHTPIEEVLCRAWKTKPDARSIVRAALILCADHELNVSSFTARCIASAGAHLYGVVIGGLAALEGPKHGGASARVESMLASLRRVRPLGPALAERQRRGEPLDGFGHPLYKDGDPRAAALLRYLEAQFGRTPECRYVAQFARAASAITGEQPNIDFALAATGRVLGLPPGSPLVIFAIGRSIGWIGHAIEQYASGQLIRPRAKYVGIVPMAVPQGIKREAADMIP